MGRWGRRH